MNQPTSEKPQSWWASVIAGIGLVFLSYCAFGYFTKAEQGLRDAETMPLLLIVLYRVAGRWGVLLIGGSMGALAIYGGWLQFWKSRQAIKKERAK